MKKYLVNFSTKNFRNSQKRLNKSALKFGIDQTFSFTFEEIKKTDFYKKNRDILDQKRGAGYWLWKPYIILEVLNKIENGDILVYSDSGIEITKDLQPLFNALQKTPGVLTFNNCGHLNKTWTKRDCFILMDCDSEKYWGAIHRFGSFSLYKKNDFSINFVKDWLRYSQDERIITDKENTLGLPNFEGFKEHRHDQSIFTLLAIKNDLELFRDPTQRGSSFKSLYPNSLYDTLLDHHRMRKGILKDKIINRIKKTFRYVGNKLKQ